MYRTDTIHLHSVSSLMLSIVVPALSCTDTTDTYRTQRLDAWPYMCAWSQVLYIVQEEAMPPTSTGAQVAQLHVVTIKATISPRPVDKWSNDRQKGNSIIPTWTRLFWQLLWYKITINFITLDNFCYTSIIVRTGKLVLTQRCGERYQTVQLL